MIDTELRDVALHHFKKATVSWPVYEKKRLAGEYKDGGAYTEWGQGFAALKAMQEPRNISLRNQAGELLKQTTKTYAYWVKATYPEREKTFWYRALYVLDQIKDSIPDPDPVVDLSVVRNVLILAEEPMVALDSPLHWRFWVTADLGYRKHYSDGAFIAEAKKQHRHIEAWCDCHTTFPDTAKAMAAPVADGGFGLDGWAGEGESAAAFDVAVAAGTDHAVVNLAALRQDQIDLIATGRFKVTAEWYRNLQPNMQPNWRNANTGVGGNCHAIYGSSDEGAVARPLTDLAPNDSIYCGGIPKPNYKELP